MNGCDRHPTRQRTDAAFVDARTGEHLCHECVIARASLELAGMLAVDDRINGVLERERRACLVQTVVADRRAAVVKLGMVDTAERLDALTPEQAERFAAIMDPRLRS